jgi:AcrR family transcriptional regulator
MPTTALDDRILDALLTVAARDGWHAAGPAGIAREAGVRLVEVYDRFPSRAALIEGLVKRTDQQVLSGEDDAASRRERLFDLVMRRIDVLQARREGYLALMAVRDPLLLPVFAAVGRSLRWMAEAADLSRRGVQRPVRLLALAAVYGTVLKAWAGDDSPDLGRTMVALDRQLDRWSGWLGLSDDVAVHKSD